MKEIYISALILGIAVGLIIGFACLLLTGNFFFNYLAPLFAVLAALVHIGTLFVLDKMKPESDR